MFEGQICLLKGLQRADTFSDQKDFVSSMGEKRIPILLVTDGISNKELRHLQESKKYPEETQYIGALWFYLSAHFKF